MSRKLTRLLLVGALAAGFGVAPMLDAYAGGPGIDVKNNQFGDGSDVQAPKNETVTWHILDDTAPHTISADPDAGGPKWPKEDSGHLEKNSDWSVTFKTPGKYHYRCEIHPEMKGTIVVPDDTPNTTAPPVTTPPTQPPATQPPATQPPATTTTSSAPASSQGTNKPPATAGPAPTTTTTAKDKKNKDDKDKKEEETTTTTAPPPPPVDLPDSAIIPVLPGLQGTNTTSQDGVALPDGAPEGDAIALLKSKKGGGDKAMKLLIVSGLGLGALGFGAAGYKYANRSSKYFPA